MFIGKNTRTKSEILIYMLVKIIIEGLLDPLEIKNEFNLSSLTIYRYFSLIKTMIYEYNFYFIDIYFNRKSKCYECKINGNYLNISIN